MCEILTGKPPYIGEDVTEVFRLASRGKLNACFDRLESSEAGPELIAITKHCLEEEPQDRFKDASVLSDRITYHLASVETRLREAELEGASQAVRLVEERKRRRVTVILGVVAAAFVALAGIGAFVLQQNRAAIADANLKNEIAELQRDQEIAAQAEKAKQAVNNELAIGQSLLAEVKGAEEPNEFTLRRLQETADRANKLLSNDLQKSELGQQTSNLSNQSQELNSTAKHVAELEEIRITDLAASMQQTWEVIYSSDRPVREINTKTLNTNRIRNAWTEWGVTPDSSAVEIGNRLQQLPAWARPSLIDSLYVWDHSLDGLDRFANAASAQWHPLILSQAESEGGAVLTRQADESILASGVNARGDVYELTFKTDLQSFNALQIEALTHPSLPRNGPGRGINGDAIANELEVFCRSSENPELARKVEIVTADADCSFYATTKPTSWNMSGAENKTHRKFHYFAEPLSAPENCEIVVRFKANTGKIWGDRNLGCFRISVTSIESNSNESTHNWIANVLKHAQVPAWTAKLWSAIHDQDVSKMVQLAQGPEAKLASDIDVLRLAGSIWQHGETEYLNQLRTNYQWLDVNVTNIKAQYRSKLVKERDGAFFVKGPNYRLSEKFDLTFTGVELPVTGFWLETIEDPRLPDNGPGTHAGPDGCAISEVSFSRTAPDPIANDSKSELQRRPITQIVSETRRVAGYSPENAIDQKTATLWKPRHPLNTKSCSTLFRIEDLSAGEFLPNMVVTIQSGANSAPGRLLGKFRLRYTMDDLAATVDPRLDAMALLRSVYSNQPDNYRLLLAMSLMSSRDTTENGTMSKSFAASAVALRPASASSLEIFANATLAQRPDPDDHWLNLLIDIAKANPSETSKRVLAIACDQQLERGKNNERGDEAKSKQAFSKAIEIDSERVYADMHSLRVLARRSLESGDLDKAQRHIISALSISSLFPQAWDLLGELRYRQNRFPEAAECFHLKLALQRGKTNEEPFRTTELMRMQQFQDAIEAIDNARASFTISRRQNKLPFIIAFAETGNLDASLKDSERFTAEHPHEIYSLEFLRTMQLKESKFSEDPRFEQVLNLSGKTNHANKFLLTSLFQPHQYPAPTVHQIGFAQVIASALAEKNDTDKDYWATAALANLSVEDWEKAKESVDRMIELRKTPNQIDLTLMAVCQWKLGDLSSLDTDLQNAVKEERGTRSGENRHLLGLVRLKTFGMLTADTKDEAFRKSTKLLLMREARDSSGWYWDRIFLGWLLRADDVQAQEAYQSLSATDGEATERSEDDARIKSWIDARLGRSEPAIAELERLQKDPNHNYIDMLFLAKAYTDAGRTEDAARAVFKSRSLFNLEWDPDQPNKHLQPEIKWAYAMAQKQLEALESVLPEYQPQRPELEYAATAKAWLKARSELETARSEKRSSNNDEFEKAYIKEDWASCRKIAMREFNILHRKSWLKPAAVSALAQDRDAYINFCENLLQAEAGTTRFGVAEVVCKACLLMPNTIDLNAIPDNAIATLLNDSSIRGSRSPWYWGTQALIQYRKGAFSDSLATIEKAQNLKPDEKLLGLLLAVKCMALHQSGEMDQYDATVTEMNKVFSKLRAPKNLSHQDFLVGRSASSRGSCDGFGKTNRPQIRFDNLPMIV